MRHDAPVTILVPVYDGLDDVRACVASVMRHAPSCHADATLLLIDDGSPDPGVAPLLDDLAARGGPIDVRVERNPENLGFVQTVNRGFALAPGDVVILNSDTIVTDGWLDRLLAAAGGPGVATVTPLTNFGSICTLPRSVIEAFDLETDAPRIDECAAFVDDHSPGVRPSIISGVGFCMVVTREALDTCGPLDAKTFGRGYGEEVDFCLRATRLGFVHVADDTTFVYHRGGVSFGTEREVRRAEASQILHQRYRWFGDANRRERAHDPLALTFTAFELGLDDRDPARTHVLQLLHSSPDALGGTEKHLHSLLVAMYDEFDFSILHPVDAGFALTTMWRRPDGSTLERHFLLPGASRSAVGLSDPVAAEALATALDLFDVDAVHIQNLIGHSLAPLEVLRSFPGPVVCSVRDLYLACPNHSLLYRNEVACGIPSDLRLCARCLPETREMSLDELLAHRSLIGGSLDAVDSWVFATQSAADYMLRAYPLPAERITVIEHGAIIDPGRPRRVDDRLLLDEPLRIAFVGRGWAKKGLDTVNALAEAVADTDIEIHHFGELVASTSPRLTLHGRYDNRLLPDLLEQAGIGVVLLPGHYAETFGHVMTEAMIAGRPVIGATYGALGERIRRLGTGWTIDPEDVPALVALIRSLDARRDELLRATERVAQVRFATVADTAPRYADLYRRRDGAPTTGDHA